MLQNTELQESTNEILLKIVSKEYWLLQRKGASTIWEVYRQIVRSDGTKLRDYYFCIGCKRLMKSGDTSSLRSHICHVKYLQRKASAEGPALGQMVSKHPGHRIHWSYRATKTLLELWESNIEDLQSETSSKARIFRKIAKEMNHLGLKPSDVKNRMDNLCDRYSREAERQKVTGRPSKWPHFHELQKLLNNPSRNSLNEENIYSDMETDGSIKRNDYDGTQDDSDTEALASQETYETELDQQDTKPKQIKGAKRWKANRFMAIQEERLALEKENLKSFQSIMKDMISCNNKLCQVLYENK